MATVLGAISSPGVVRNTCVFFFYFDKKGSGEQTQEKKNGVANTPEIKSETAPAPAETSGNGNQGDKTGYIQYYLFRQPYQNCSIMLC